MNQYVLGFEEINDLLDELSQLKVEDRDKICKVSKKIRMALKEYQFLRI